MIEDIKAWENLDEILSVDGIDTFFVAPSDFAASMGYINNITHPEVQEKLDDSINRIVSSGKTAGTLANDENVELRNFGIKATEAGIISLSILSPIITHSSEDTFNTFIT